MSGGEMIVQVFLALPLFTKDEQPFFKDICVEFIPGTSRLCTDKGHNPANLIHKILAMIRVNTTPGCNEQHTYNSG
jgi:hypothetical protein